MSESFSDTGSSLTFNPNDDSDGSVFPMSGVDTLEETARKTIEYDNSIKFHSPNNPVISVARRNERERKRVRLVNQGFAILRDRVPRDQCNRGRRSSKVETLRAAIMYIRQLQQLLLESQIRYQEQGMSQCFSYVGDDSFLNSPVPSASDNYSFSNSYSQAIIQAPSYHHLRANGEVQHADELCDRYIAVPWFA